MSSPMTSTLRLFSEMVDAARRDGLDITPAVADISDSAAVGRMVADAVNRFGAVDVLVNNAIIHPNRGERGPFLKVPPEGWHDFLTRNLDALYFVTSSVARIMAKNRRGSIINISSNGAVLAHRQSIPYDTLKGALEAFTRALAVDLAPWQVRVNALRPIAVADPAPRGLRRRRAPPPHQ